MPAIIVSPWVDEGIVINDEHRHTSMIATLRKVWGLGDAFTDRDAAAAPFDHLLSRDSPRDPATWPDVKPLPVPEFHMDMVQMGKALSTLGKTAGGGMLERAKQSGLRIFVRSCRRRSASNRRTAGRGRLCDCGQLLPATRGGCGIQRRPGLKAPVVPLLVPDTSSDLSDESKSGDRRDAWDAMDAQDPDVLQLGAERSPVQIRPPRSDEARFGNGFPL